MGDGVSLVDELDGVVDAPDEHEDHGGEQEPGEDGCHLISHLSRKVHDLGWLILYTIYIKMSIFE